MSGLTEAQREELFKSINFWDDEADDLYPVVEAIVAEQQAKALRDAADDPSLRLSGHSGISIKRLRDRADFVETGAGA